MMDSSNYKPIIYGKQKRLLRISCHMHLGGIWTTSGKTHSGNCSLLEVHVCAIKNNDKMVLFMFTALCVGGRHGILNRKHFSKQMEYKAALID